MVNAAIRKRVMIMRSFYIYLAIGIILAALLLAVFFKAGKKGRRKQQSDHDLVYNLGDEGLIRLYEQAQTDKEKDDIVEFAREKLASEQTSATGDSAIMPAGALNAEKVAPPETITEETEPAIAPFMSETEEAEPALTQFMPEAEETEPAIAPFVQEAEEAEPAIAPFVQEAEKAEPALTQFIPEAEKAEPALTQFIPETEEAEPAIATLTPETEEVPLTPEIIDIEGPATSQESSVFADNGALQNAGIHTYHTQTHELPMDKVDWAAIEEAMEKKREEDARMMAHNQLIQDVFSKIQGVESRVVGENREDDTL